VSASILLIDNYDSFVYNLSRYFEELGCRTRVVRNDALSVSAIRAMDPVAIVLSPGPCTPFESGVSLDVIRRLGADVPILGVCLGHQAIAAALGGEVVRSAPMHGRTSAVWHDTQGLFEGLPNPLTAARYHSLAVEETTLPPSLQVTARTSDGTVMALRHRQWPLWGVQFHPESILTDRGHHMLANFLALAGVRAHAPDPREMSAETTDGDFFSRSIERDHPPP
jgi:anthranilate synthase/aminodeoxychorismate synthase-like glutamine amidotransferase